MGAVLEILEAVGVCEQPELRYQLARRGLVLRPTALRRLIEAGMIEERPGYGDLTLTQAGRDVLESVRRRDA